jgi:hypothetical protein
MEKIWVAREAWTDSWENQPSAAFGYRNVGFFESEPQARAWVECGGPAPKCWATPQGAPNREVVELHRILVK